MRLPRDTGLQPVRGAWNVGEPLFWKIPRRSHGLQTRVTGRRLRAGRPDRLTAVVVAA